LKSHFYKLIGRKVDEKKLKDKLSEFVEKKVKYSIGDYVYLEGESDEPSAIVQIYDIWKLSR
jgi:hypothetical protein